MERESEKLVDDIKVLCTIYCNICKKEESVNDMDEWLAADVFHKKGWKKKSTRIYCPECLNNKK